MLYINTLSRDIYPILIHWAEIYTLSQYIEPNYTLSQYIEANYTLSLYNIELYPTLKHRQGISSHWIKSNQYSQAWKLTAGVIICPRRNNSPCGGPEKSSKSLSRKSLTVPKNVAHCRKRVIPYLYTLKLTIAHAYTLPNAIPYLNTCIPYLNTCITYHNTLTRLSALGSIS